MKRSANDSGAATDFEDAFTKEVVFAEGTGLVHDAPAPIPYRVTIKYREPEFEARRGRREQPFQWTYRIAATGLERATEAAISQFHDTARMSSVGWRRDIVSIEAVKLDEDDPGAP